MKAMGKAHRRARRYEAAYRRGRHDALVALKLALLVDAEQRIIDRQPYTMESLSIHVMDTINRFLNPAQKDESFANNV
jgi:hypothetical protein